MNIVKSVTEPEKMIAKAKEGRKNIENTLVALTNALLQTQSAFSVLSDWQESFLENLLPLAKTDFVFRKNMEAYKKYGQVSSIQEAVEKLPVARNYKKEISEKIDQKVRDWALANKEVAYLSARMRTILVKNLMKRFQCETLDRIPCALVPEVLEWLSSYRFPDLLGFGPLAAVLAHTRAVRRIGMAEAARRCGVRKSTYARWEGSGQVPHERYWPAISKFTGREDIANLVEMQEMHSKGRPVTLQ